MAKKESATRKESASPVQVDLARGTETGEDVVGVRRPKAAAPPSGAPTWSASGRRRNVT